MTVRHGEIPEQAGLVAGLAAARVAVERPDELAPEVHRILLGLQDQHGPTGLLAYGVALADWAAQLLKILAPLVDRDPVDVLDEVDLKALRRGQH